MTREQLLIKIEQIKDKLTYYEEKLDKVTPHRPSVSEHKEWNGKTKQMDITKEYFCWYCGGQLRKGTKKHKCGYLVDWNGILDKEEKLC